MAQQRSIFFSTVRAFCVGLFSVIGVAVGLVILVLLLAAAVSPSPREAEMPGRYRVRSNAEGIIAPLGRQTPLVLSIDISGVIGTEELNAKVIREQLERSRMGALKGDRVKAVLLRVNTPGGSALASDDIYRLLLQYKEQYDVPIYAYAEGLCASGGMYCTAAADKLYATEASLIGSVGVMMNFLNVSKTLGILGVESLTLTRGLDKDTMNPLRPWKEGEDKEMLQLIDYYYKLFVQIMIKGRPNLTEEALVDKIGARVFPAPEATHIGLIDGVVSGEREVLAELVQAAGLEGEDYQVVQLETRSWLEQILQGKSPLVTGKIRHELISTLPEGILYLYRPLSSMPELKSGS